MNNRWVKYLMAGSVTVLMVLVIIFIIRSVKENSLVVSCPDTLVVEYGSTNDEADINETMSQSLESMTLRLLRQERRNIFLEK